MKETLVDVIKLVLDSADENSDSDFYTSGIKNAQNSYYKTQRMLKRITKIIVIVCFLIIVLDIAIF